MIILCKYCLPHEIIACSSINCTGYRLTTYRIKKRYLSFIAYIQKIIKFIGQNISYICQQLQRLITLL